MADASDVYVCASTLYVVSIVLLLVLHFFAKGADSVRLVLVVTLILIINSRADFR